ncbi:MAG TPA: TonB-dependent receptor, partial [Sphingobacteriaceae bacterium]
YYLGQLDLTGKFNTGSIQHTVLAGADLDQYKTRTPAFKIIYDPQNPQVNTYDVINIYDLSAFPQRSDIPEAQKVSLANNRVSRAGIYVQDLVALTSKIKLLAGLRYTYSETNSATYTYSTNLSKTAAPRSDDAFTPRLGLVLQPTAQMSLFASYANSFNLNKGIDASGSPLAPSFIDQYELGIKNELFNGALSANVTAYKIVNSNLAQTILQTDPLFNPQYPTAQQLSGEVTSKGVELDVMSRTFHGISVIAGYSFNDTRYTRSQIYQVGSSLRYNPKHTANASINYAFTDNQFKGLNLGITAQYFGDRYAGRSTRLTVQNDQFRLMPLEAFTQLDATAGYSKENISLRFKISNLLNAMNYFAHDDNSLNPIAPRQFATTLAYKF